jgi:hypothetical protein
MLKTIATVYKKVRLVKPRVRENTLVYQQVRLVKSRVRDKYGLLSSAPSQLAFSRQIPWYFTKCA